MQERSNAEFVRKHRANALMVSFEMGYIPVCLYLNGGLLYPVCSLICSLLVSGRKAIFLHLKGKVAAHCSTVYTGIVCMLGVLGTRLVLGCIIIMISLCLL